MLKTSKSAKSLIRPGKGGVGVGDSQKVRYNRNRIDDGKKVDEIEIEDNEVGKKVQKMSKSKNLSKSKKTIGSSDFFIFEAKLAFTKLK